VWKASGVLPAVDGRSVGWVVSSLSGGGRAPGGLVDTLSAGEFDARLGFDMLLSVLSGTRGDADLGRAPSFVGTCACAGSGGSGRLWGGGSGRRATLFRALSHSGASSSNPNGVWCFELPRSGIADKGRCSSCLRNAWGSISVISSDEAWMVISSECAVLLERCF